MHQKRKISGFRKFLLRWGRNKHRALPWRSRPTPYRILVAEFFLQRTDAEQAARQYIRFVEKYRNFRSLRRTSPRELNKFLGPLGLKKRVIIFRRLIREINDRYNGSVPSDYTSLTRLPGIGDYGANAVLLFAHGRKRGLVDANTIRVFSRLLEKGITREEGKRSKLIRECAEYFSSLGRDPKRSNWLLLDYGAELEKKFTTMGDELK